MIENLKPNELNCNIFSAYDYPGMTIQELLCQFFTKINECVEVSNESKDIIEWIKNIGLKDEVVKRLEEWLQDGTLENIINVEVFTKLNDSLNATNYDNPLYVTTLRGNKTSVMQMFAILNNGKYLISQTGINEATEKESFTISLVNDKGNVESFMELKNGGHGVFTHYENEYGDIDILFTDNNGRILKTRYFPSTIDVEKNEGVTILPKYSSDFQLINVNYEDDRVVLVNKNVSGYWYIAYVYKYSEYLLGNASPLTSINSVIEQTDTLQGLSVDKNNVYFTVGVPYETQKLYVCNIIAKSKKTYIYKFKNVVESEGALIYKNELYVGFCFGEPSIIRSNNIYKFSSLANLGSVVTNSGNTQNYKLTEGDGSVKAIPLPSNLSDIVEPGEYYFTSTQFSSFNDRPDNYKNVSSGFFLTVSAKSKDGSVLQTLRRNTSTNKQYESRRTVGSTSTSPWNSCNPEGVTLFYGDTRNSTLVELSDSIFNYDFIHFKVWSPSGKWDNLFTNVRLLINDKKIIFTGANIGDSPDSIVYYPYEMHVTISENGLVLSQDSKSELVISPPNVNVRRNCSVGICEVIGFKGIYQI